MEEDLDAAYQGYLQRQGVRAEAARQKRKRLGMDRELGSDEEQGADANKPEYEPGSDAEEAEEVSTHACPGNAANSCSTVGWSPGQLLHICCCVGCCGTIAL